MPLPSLASKEVSVATERKVAALPPPPTLVTRIAGVPFESLSLVVIRPKRLTAAPPPSIRILPLPALITLSVASCETPVPVKEIKPPWLVRSVREPKVRLPTPALSKMFPPSVVRSAKFVKEILPFGVDTDIGALAFTVVTLPQKVKFSSPSWWL